MRLLVLAALLAAASASAQPVWRATPTGTSVSLDVLKMAGGTSFTYQDENGAVIGTERPRWVHSAQILSGRLLLTDRLAAVAELPFAVHSYDYSEAAPSARPPFISPEEWEAFLAARSEAQVGIGNPYLGIDARVTSALALGGGVRLPLSREPASQRAYLAAESGITAHLEQAEAYNPHRAALAFHARYERPLGRTPVGVRIQASPTLLYDVTAAGDLPEGNERLQGTLAYGVQAFATAGPARVGGGLVGRRFVLDPREIGDFFNSTALRLEAVADRLPVQPGISARIPLSGPDFSDAIVSLSLTVPVR